jgi:outer membrane protein TolC
VSLRNLFIEYLVKVAIDNAPEIKSLDYNLKATKRTINLNGFGRFIPTLSLNGQYNKNFNQWGAGSEQSLILDNNYNVGVQVSIPIFNRMQTNINKQTAEIQQQQLTINKQNIALGIDANINSAVLNLTNQIANIEISKISEKTAKQSLELTQVSYANGAVNIVQLLDAQNNYLSAQLSQITAVYNYLLSSIEIERYMSYYFLLHTQEENQDFIQKFYDYIQDRN